MTIPITRYAIPMSVFTMNRALLPVRRTITPSHAVRGAAPGPEVPGAGGTQTPGRAARARMRVGPTDPRYAARAPGSVRWGRPSLLASRRRGSSGKGEIAVHGSRSARRWGVGATMAVLLSSCGGGGGGSGGGGGLEGGKVGAQDWIKSACTSIGSWVQDIQKRVNGV